MFARGIVASLNKLRLRSRRDEGEKRKTGTRETKKKVGERDREREKWNMHDVYNNKPTGSESRCGGVREDNKKKAGNTSTGGKTPRVDLTANLKRRSIFGPRRLLL